MKENNNNQTNSTKNCFLKKLSHYKSWYSSKVFIAVIFTVLGICGTTLANSIGKDKNNDNIFKFTENFHHNFYKNIENQNKQIFAMFDNEDIFKEMAEMQENMDQIFANHRKRISQMIHETQKNSADTQKNSVTSREDKDNYYYDLSFSGFKKEDISVLIKDNNLSFSLQKNQNSETKNQKSQSSSSFYYSFSLPEYNKKVDPEIIKQDDKITVKFTKINSDQA